MKLLIVVEHLSSIHQGGHSFTNKTNVMLLFPLMILTDYLH